MPRDSFGGGVSAAYFVMSLAAPLTAAIINRIHPRLILFFGTLLFALSKLLLGIVVNGPLGFTTDFGVIAGMGFSIGGLLPLQTIVANWFVRR